MRHTVLIITNIRVEHEFEVETDKDIDVKSTVENFTEALGLPILTERITSDACCKAFEADHRVYEKRTSVTFTPLN